MSELTVDMLLKLAGIAEQTPKASDLVLFIGRNGGELIDNCKYCYLESVRGDYGFKSLFYPASRKEAAFLDANNIPYLKELDLDVLSRVSTIVCDDFHWRKSVMEFMTRGAKIFQLWHGIPLKSIGLIQAKTEHDNMPPERQQWLNYGYSGYDAVLSTSSYVSENIFNQVFATKRFVNLGYPRNDVLLRPLSKLDKLDMINVPQDVLARLQEHRRSGGKVMVYMPTFRDYVHDGTVESGSELGIKALGEFGAKHNVLFLLKFHPYVRIGLANLPEHCIFCPPFADAYPLLRFTDALITDFSSVYFDYLLLNRPIHYFVHDKEEYEEKDRKFMLNFDDWTPGHKSRTQEECFAALEQLLVNNMDDGLEGERIRMRDILFDNCDDRAAVRCCEFVAQMVKAI